MAKGTFHGVLNRRAQCGNDAKRRVSIAETARPRGSEHARSSRMGIVGIHPAVFVRVANTGVTGYGTWKSA